MSESEQIIAFRAFHDEDAGVWVGISDTHDIATEGASRDNLVDRILTVVPDVLEARGQSFEGAVVHIQWQAMQTYDTTQVKLATAA